ncbi:MAG: hypothetical protein F6K62_16790 [Sphaerospermopsis sp. SIO1G2]|nr:hypothetical protein [Sphaerospermopsis sp. SIO1G2]
MFNDFTKWQEVYSGTFFSTFDSCNRRIAIPEIFPAINNPTNNLLVGCFSTSAQPSWKVAGWFYQIVPFPFKDGYLFSQQCFLQKYNLIQVPTTGLDPFKISFQPRRWLDDITLKISLFT